MATTIELSASQMPRPLPLPTFSAPFAVPSLRWVCKRRLRCFHDSATAAAAALRFSPSPDNRNSLSPASDGGAPVDCSRPSPPSDRAGNLIGIPEASRAEDAAEDPPPSLPSAAPAETVGARSEGEPRPGGEEAVGWSLRSRVRGGDDEKGDKAKRKRKAELWVSLSREEIERDFLRMTGAKPPRRTRRGQRAGSNHLLLGIFPGSGLPTSIAADRYKVAEPPSDSRKRWLGGS